jgi:hypothetical protein
VSPSWRDRVCISLSPGRVGLLRFGRGWGPSLVGSDFACDEAQTNDADGSGALRMLESMLAKEPQRGGDASVVLSGHFLRYALLPWSDEAVDERDWVALAQHQFRLVYGDVALEWVTTAQVQGPGQPVLACASRRLLIDALHGVIRASGLRLRSVRPYFATAFNACRSQLPEASFWFGVVEPGRFSFGECVGGGWVSLASRRLGADAAARLNETLEQEALGGDASVGRGPAYILSPEQPIAETEDELGWAVRALSLGEGMGTVADPRLTAALTALA